MKTKKNLIITLLVLMAILLSACSSATNSVQSTESSQASTSDPTMAVGTTTTLTYAIVDSAQGKCYNASVEIPCSQTSFSGQDAQYSGSTPSYTDNGDGTITDNITGLMWQQDPGEKVTYDQAVAGASSFDLAGYTDWRLPNIKELYSLILFDGTDVSACPSGTSCTVTPFIDTRYFDFSYGDTSAGERVIDSQFASSTKYVSTTMNGAETVFGVNFADGRIKGYGTGAMPGQSDGKLFSVLYVRDNPAYGQNNFVDNGDGTVADNATDLTWTQADSGEGMDWEAALTYCENMEFGGESDWRLPNTKELQSIVDYSRSPATTNSAAIDPLFNVTGIINEAGEMDYPFYWSSTTHADSSGNGSFAAYVAFGEAPGYMGNTWLDVHGVGAQRSDPKTGSASEFPEGHGPQGDAVRVDNYVRCVRAGNITATQEGIQASARPMMTITSSGIRNQGTSLPNSSQTGNGQTPPTEALAACASSELNATCQFTAPNGTITGTCQTVQQQLACVPTNKP